jgi:hypothetical protein
MQRMWWSVAAALLAAAGGARAEAPPEPGAPTSPGSTRPSTRVDGAASALPPPEVVEQVIAVVRGPGTAQPRVITLSRLKEEARIALVSRGAVAAASAPLDGDTLRATLEWLIDQTLLGDEVARLQVFEVPADVVETEVRRFRERFANPGQFQAFLARLDLEEDDLAAVLRRMLRVQQYVESRITARGRVSDTDAQAWIAAHPDRVAGLELADAERVARAALEDERAAQQVKTLVADLRARSDVRLVGDVEGRGS